MDKKILAVPVVVLLALLLINFFRNDNNVNENEILVMGNIEVTEVDVSFKIPGRVVERLVSEGEWVEYGQDIALIDARELIQETSLREAEVMAAKAALVEVKAGYLPEEIAQGQARLNQAEADLQRQQLDYERQESLHEKKVISSREFEVSRSLFDVAKAKQREVQERLTMLKKGIRKEKIMQAEAKYQVAEQGLALAQTRLSYAKLTAPITGYVLSENIEPGEIVAIGTPIVTIGDLRRVWLRAYVNELDLGRVKLGQRVEVVSDSYADKIYPGTITFIASHAEFTPKNVQTEKERVKLVYRVKIEIDNANMELKPGMPAEAKILLDS